MPLTPDLTAGGFPLRGRRHLAETFEVCVVPIVA